MSAVRYIPQEEYDEIREWERKDGIAICCDCHGMGLKNCKCIAPAPRIVKRTTYSVQAKRAPTDPRWVRLTSARDLDHARTRRDECAKQPERYGLLCIVEETTTYRVIPEENWPQIVQSDAD